VLRCGCRGPCSVRLGARCRYAIAGVQLTTGCANPGAVVAP
jgi:hypothetical protein